MGIKDLREYVKKCIFVEKVTLLDKVRSCIHGNYDTKQSHLMFNRSLYGHKKVCLEQNIS